MRSSSSDGISTTSYLLETFSFMISLFYNLKHDFPFTTFGETLFLTIQNCIILMLIQYYNRNYFRLILVLLLLVGMIFTIKLPLDLLSMLMSATIPITLLSKLPQIISNYRQSSTGQLSGTLIVYHSNCSVYVCFG
jgi:mannose-P-dolichol utilization defect protein 1